MANFRQIHVSIWKDSWFLDLEPDEKLLFVYLFSNESTSLSGMYRISKKVIVFETGIDKPRINEILSKFASDKKVYYHGDVVWILNMRKFHSTKSHLVQKRIENDIALIPDCEIKRMYITYNNGNIPYTYPIHTDSQLKEDEEENEKEEYKKDPFAFIQKTIETITGVLSSGKSSVDAIDELVKIKATKADIQAGYEWLIDNGKKVSWHSQLVGPTKTAMSKRMGETNKKKRSDESLKGYKPA